MSEFDAWIGRETVEEEQLAAGQVAGLLAALDRAPEARPGDDAPLGAHWLLAPPRAPMSEIREDGHPRRGGFLPPIAEPRRMWAASEVEFLRPLAVGAICRRSSRIAAINRKQGKSGSFWLVEIDHRVASGGKDAIRERQTIVYLGGNPQTGGEAAREADWTFRKRMVPDPVLLFRYSALTFNGHRIHYDLPYARDVEGYPGLVVQGPLIATLLLDLARQSFGLEKIARFSFRARSPAFADQPIELVARREGEGAVLAALGPDHRLFTSARISFRSERHHE